MRIRKINYWKYSPRTARRITEVLNKLEHAEKGNKNRVRPDWDNELKYILEGDRK